MTARSATKLAIPVFRWNGEDENSLAENAFIAAVSRPIAGAITLAPATSRFVRSTNEYDGGITRVNLAAWKPNDYRNLEYVRSCAAWAHANCKPGHTREVIATTKHRSGECAARMEQNAGVSDGIDVETVA